MKGLRLFHLGWPESQCSLAVLVCAVILRPQTFSVYCSASRQEDFLDIPFFSTRIRLRLLRTERVLVGCTTHLDTLSPIRNPKTSAVVRFRIVHVLFFHSSSSSCPLSSRSSKAFPGSSFTNSSFLLEDQIVLRFSIHAECSRVSPPPRPFGVIVVIRFSAIKRKRFGEKV